MFNPYYEVMYGDVKMYASAGQVQIQRKPVGGR